MSQAVLRRVKEDKDVRSTNDILLHPLVIMNISDHYTRSRVGPRTLTGPSKRVVGALFGQQQGRRVEIHTTFELVFTEKDGTIIIDTAIMRQKKEQYTAVFPNYEVLGWYMTGDAIFEKDTVAHKELMQFNESPLLLVVDCEPGKDARSLGAYVYETSVEVTKDSGVSYSFQRVGYNIESEESERIGIQNVTQIDSDNSGRSALMPHCATLSVAVTMLQSRVQIVTAYLRAVQAGEIPPDHQLLRRLSSLCNKLPCADSAGFDGTFSTEYQDVELITYLGLLSKGSSTLNDVIDRYRFAFEKSRRPQHYF
jgi:COP9 signalosome complex subunit 6